MLRHKYAHPLTFETRSSFPGVGAAPPVALATVDHARWAPCTAENGLKYARNTQI